jgi:hypothetical protein
MTLDSARLRVRHIGAKVRAQALIQREQVDSDPVFSVLKEAREGLGRLPALDVVEGRYLRYIWDYSAAMEAFELALSNVTHDFRVTRDARLGAAHTIMDIVTYQSDNGPVLHPPEDALAFLGDLAYSTSEGALLAIRCALERSREFPSLVEEVIDILKGPARYANIIGNNNDLLQIAAELADTEAQDDSIARLCSGLTDPQWLLDFAGCLVRAAELTSTRALVYLDAALRCLDGVRVMTLNQVRTPRHAFLEGRALLLAAELTGERSPLGWARIIEASTQDDLELAIRRLQSAHDTSVGSFELRTGELLEYARIASPLM